MKTYVARTCTKGDSSRPISLPVESYRETPVYVLLGDSGAGKTSEFRHEAEQSGGKYFSARDFIALEPVEDTVYFIDGLDELRAGASHGRVPLDLVRSHLNKIGCKKFRLSCREADWLGRNDEEAIKVISPDHSIEVLHLDKLTREDVETILSAEEIVPDDFIAKASDHRLEDLLYNPQNLNLLIRAVKKQSKWPENRTQIYEMACRELVSENNEEHNRLISQDVDSLLNGAGYLCALQLLAGISGFALNKNAADEQYFNVKDLKSDLPLSEVLKTNLFKYDGAKRRTPIHRSVAEYLGACYLDVRAKADKSPLPLGRILALILGDTWMIDSDLRGLAAWLAVLNLPARDELIQRDPTGILFYGDVRLFSVSHKKIILEALKSRLKKDDLTFNEMQFFREFGALATTDMAPVFFQYLSSSSRNEADQDLLNVVLNAMIFGQEMPDLANIVDAIARDKTYLSKVRFNALRVLISKYPDRLKTLADDIRMGVVEDWDDDLLGELLATLYPHKITPNVVLDYLHRPHQSNWRGAYLDFWESQFFKLTKTGDVPFLLDECVRRKDELRKASWRGRIEDWVVKLLIQGLGQSQAENISNQRLYKWLGLLGSEFPLLQKEDQGAIKNWFAIHPERYKAIIEYAALSCAGERGVMMCMHERCLSTLRNLPPPSDIVSWFLEKAKAEKNAELMHCYFNWAVSILKGDAEISTEAVEFLRSHANTFSYFEDWLKPFITPLVSPVQEAYALQAEEKKNELQVKKQEWVSYFHQHIDAIKAGSARGILHDLARAYNGELPYEAKGATHEERLSDFLKGDQELIDAAHDGFRHILNQPDLPTVKEIIELDLQSKMYTVRAACLIGIEALYQQNPVNALRLSHETLAKLLAFRFTADLNETLPPWVGAVIQQHSELAAEVFTSYIRRLIAEKKEFVRGLFRLWSDDAYKTMAPIVVWPLLESFPHRVPRHSLENELRFLLKCAIDLDKKKSLVIIKKKLTLKGLDAAQKLYWLASGFIIESDVYANELRDYVGKSQSRRRHLKAFFNKFRLPALELDESVLGVVIELLASGSSSDLPGSSYIATPEIEATKLAHSFIYKLSTNPSEMAAKELQRLQRLEGLADWHLVLKQAIEKQCLARVKARGNPSVKEVCRALTNHESANAADLAALVFTELQSIANFIRTDENDIYQQCWEKKGEPKNENECRNVLLSHLKPRLEYRYNVECQRESSCADNTRVDIKFSEKGWKVPLEIKCEWSPQLWTAINDQLVKKYMRNSSEGGYGIYVVFWFGLREGPPPLKQLRDAKDLENRLRETLTEEQGRSIQICVIDCEWPVSKK